MATHVVGGLRKASEAVQHTASKHKKIIDLQHDTVSLSNKITMTTDHGVKVENTDQWLRVVDDKHTGPSLLEDQLAREKASQTPINSTAPDLRIKIFTDTY
jgi:catalase